MTTYAAMMYTVVLVVSIIGLIVMSKLMPEVLTAYIIWVGIVDIILFWFLLFYTSNVGS